MKRAIIPIIITLAVAVSSCGPKRYLTTSRAPGVGLDTINYGAYNNDPSADKARPAFMKANGPIREYNRLQLYNLEPTELAILRGATVTTAELNRISGVTSAVQTQINGRIRAVDSTGNAAGNYVTRKALADTVTNKSARIVRDTITDYLADATVGIALADSNLYNGGYATRTFVESLLGSGSGMTTQRLPFIVGTTSGAPANADTIVTHTAFSGKHIDLYRDGVKQYQNFTATNTIDGFRVNASNVIVNPAWAMGEQVIIDITEPVFWGSLAFEGEESSLLTGLEGYWKLDETSGTTATDATGTQDGTVIGSASRVSGKLGYGLHIENGDQLLRLPYNASIQPHGTAFSVSIWVYLDSVPTDTGRDGYLFIALNDASPSSPHELYVESEGVNAGKLHFYSRNSSGTIYGAVSTTVLTKETWYNIVAVNSGDGNPLTLYINGTEDATGATFSGTVFEANNRISFGNVTAGYADYVPNVIDECAIWSRALTSGEVSSLYNSGNGRTHPFN